MYRAAEGIVKLRSRSRSGEGQVRVRWRSGEGQVRVRKVKVGCQLKELQTKSKIWTWAVPYFGSFQVYMSLTLMRVQLVQWNIWCGMDDKLTCQPWAKWATHAAVKIFLSPSPIKFWSQIPRIKNIPDRGSTVGPKSRPENLNCEFYLWGPLSS